MSALLASQGSGPNLHCSLLNEVSTTCQAVQCKCEQAAVRSCKQLIEQPGGAVALIWCDVCSVWPSVKGGAHSAAFMNFKVIEKSTDTPKTVMRRGVVSGVWFLQILFIDLMQWLSNFFCHAPIWREKNPPSPKRLQQNEVNLTFIGNFFYKKHQDHDHSFHFSF